MSNTTLEEKRRAARLRAEGHAPDPVEKVERQLSDFQERAMAEAKRFEDATDSEFWCCLVFRSRAEKEEFLARTGLAELGDKYIDGKAAAEVLGVELETPEPATRKPREPSARLVELVAKELEG